MRSVLSKSPKYHERERNEWYLESFEKLRDGISPSPIFQYVVQYRKIHCLKSEFHVEINVKNLYRTSHEAMSAISVF